MVVYITEKSVWAGPTLSHVAFACSYILCVKKKILLDVEKSLWAGPTRGLWFFVRGACGRDPPGGGAFKKNVLHNPVGLGESYTLHSQMIRRLGG